MACTTESDHDGGPVYAPRIGFPRSVRDAGREHEAGANASRSSYAKPEWLNGDHHACVRGYVMHETLAWEFAGRCATSSPMKPKPRPPT
jgi:hypothetical protein